MTETPFWCPRCRRDGQAQYHDRPWCIACAEEGAPPHTYNRRKLRRKIRQREERAAGQRKESDGRPPAPQHQ